MSVHLRGTQSFGFQDSVLSSHWARTTLNEIPEPGPGDVLVKLEARKVNVLDLRIQAAANP
jgi:hypothetical protein